MRKNNANTTSVSINVYDTILLMQQRQDWLRNYLKDSGFQELPFVGTFANSDDIKSIANDRCYTVNELVNAARQYCRLQNGINKESRYIKFSDKNRITSIIIYT